MIKTLIVDDEPAALERYSAYVEEYGHCFSVVARCTSASEAFAAVGREKPDLFMTDIRMPGEDGLSLLARLRDSGWQGCAVIISGYDDFTYAQQAIRLGVFDFLLKPVFPEDIRSLLDKVSAKFSCGMTGEATDRDRGKISSRFGTLLPQAHTGRELPDPVRKALSFIALHYDSGFSLDEAAASSCVSPSWLSAMFKRIYGCSFMEYARHYRVAKACELLAQGDFPLKEIADRLAFPDLPTFSKLFRKIAGMSPGAFRKAERAGAPGGSDASRGSAVGDLVDESGSGGSQS